MFHRKVHPENSTAAQKSGKAQKNENKKKIGYDSSCNSGEQVLQDEGIMSRPQRALLKQNIRRYKSQSNPPQFMLSSIDSNGNREHWIKTDADCKDLHPKSNYLFLLSPACIFWIITEFLLLVS